MKVPGIIFTIAVAVVLACIASWAWGAEMCRREAIRVGVARYVLKDAKTGAVSFEWIVPENGESK